MKVIGLTGGIASGKSTVSKMIQALGYPVIDADIAARKVVEVGSPGLHEIVNLFGQEILQEDGALDRAKLGQIIFADENKRHDLNAVVHPKVFAWMESEKERYMEAGESLIFMDIPLLYESKHDYQFAAVIVVYTHETEQLSRLMMRDQLAEDVARQRINAQYPLADKKRLADFVIDNSSDLATTTAQLLAIIAELTA